MIRKSYSTGDVYEKYINWAMCSRIACNGEMATLVDIENGVKPIGSFSLKKALSIVKKHMVTATDSAIKWNVCIVERQELSFLRKSIEVAQDSTVLLEICRQGMDVLRKYQNLS